MDYLDKTIRFKLCKVLRYIKIFGLQRTYTKVIGQLHMSKKFDNYPVARKTNRNQFVGFIGCGNFPFTTLAYFIKKKYGNVFGACMDIDINRAASLGKRYNIPVCSNNADDVLNNQNIKIVIIASNHQSHAEYAIKALENGKHVYIEKPHVTTEDQLNRLITAMKNSVGKVFLGFNRPNSTFGKIIKETLTKEQGSAIFNWHIVGHDLPNDHWYLNNGEGGRILGNFCHWSDFTMQLLNTDSVFPLTINPSKTEQNDINVAVNYCFNDSSLATITFSEKGHAFEGVRERFSVQKGNCYISMEDFKTMVIDINEKKLTYNNMHRQHGHENSIIEAVTSVKENLPYDREKQIEYIWNTGILFLKTKEALDNNKKITVNAYQPKSTNRLKNYQEIASENLS